MNGCSLYSVHPLNKGTSGLPFSFQSPTKIHQNQTLYKYVSVKAKPHHVLRGVYSQEGPAVGEGVLHNDDDTYRTHKAVPASPRSIYKVGVDWPVTLGHPKLTEDLQMSLGHILTHGI